jgi:membrane-bound lytic murein transglycosylase MltF
MAISRRAFLAGLCAALAIPTLHPVALAATPLGEPRFQALLRPWTGDLDGMVQRRFIRVLVAHSRTNYFLDGARQKGATFEGMEVFKDWLNTQLGPGRHVEMIYIPMRRDELFTAMAEGRGDILAASLTVTPEREALVDFTEPWQENASEFLVTGPAAPPLQSLDDLAGQEVWVRRSSSYYESLTGLNRRLAAKGLKPVRIREADENLEGEDILEMVSAGIMPMTVLDDYRAAIWATILPGLRVRTDMPVAQGRHMAPAVRKNCPQLKELLSRCVVAQRQGATRARLSKTYFRATDYLRNPTASEDLRRFNQAVGLFQRYGDKYGLDYLLVAAQGYQESHLDQSARSPRGAVGVMQLLPSTAASAPVSIPDITKLDRNIEAGVKYHRHLIDTWFDDPAIPPQDRILLAFAAYNAGPGNVIKMRKLAKDMGFDPNRWFANVEVAAGRITGQETVRYVSNIFKYYVAYKLVMDRRAEIEEAKAKAEEAKGKK